MGENYNNIIYQAVCIFCGELTEYTNCEEFQPLISGKVPFLSFDGFIFFCTHCGEYMKCTEIIPFQIKEHFVKMRTEEEGKYR